MHDVEKETVDKIVGLIREVIGEEWANELDIDTSSSFSEDLELESIEMVALAEKLQAHYGERVNFVGWLSGKQIDEIIELTVSDLATHIVDSLSEAAPDRPKE